jgi:hypothetical protein
MIPVDPLRDNGKPARVYVTLEEERTVRAYVTEEPHEAILANVAAPHGPAPQYLDALFAGSGYSRGDAHVSVFRRDGSRRA